MYFLLKIDERFWGKGLSGKEGGGGEIGREGKEINIKLKKADDDLI